LAIAGDKSDGLQAVSPVINDNIENEMNTYDTRVTYVEILTEIVCREVVEK
jgi:hypothetical protein